MGASRDPFDLGVGLDPFSHGHDSIPFIPAAFCVGRSGPVILRLVKTPLFGVGKTHFRLIWT